MQNGIASLPNLDPIKDIDSITESDVELYSQAVSINKIQESSKYVSSKAVYRTRLKKMMILIIRSEMVLIVLTMTMKMFRQ